LELKSVLNQVKNF